MNSIYVGGKNLSCGDNVIIHPGVKIGKNCKIGSFCEIGNRFTKNNNIYIGDNVTINSHSIIYPDCHIEDNCFIGHRVLIREHTNIGYKSQIGSYSDIEGIVKIGKYVKIHSNVHIGQTSVIEDFCWLFPYTILTNDPIPPSEILNGPKIFPFSVIATRSTILPGVEIGFGSFVGANSLVNKNIPAEKIATGNPLRIRGKVSLIKHPHKKIKAYPWALRIENDYYPKNIDKIYEELSFKYFN